MGNGSATVFATKNYLDHPSGVSSINQMSENHATPECERTGVLGNAPLHVRHVMCGIKVQTSNIFVWPQNIILDAAYQAA